MTSQRVVTTGKVARVRPLILSIAILFALSPLLSSFSSLVSTGIGTKNYGVVPASAAEVKEAPPGVIVLNSRNFDSELRDGNIWLIEFYAPWCSHCTRFAPAYESIAKKLHGKVKVAKINGADERALSSRFGVQGFPSFYLIDGWTVRHYEGARSQEKLVKFVLETYEDVEPVPFLFGPFGPMGQLRALLMWTGTKFVGIFDHLSKERGMSQLVAASIMCAGGIFGGLFLIMVIGILLLPKPKVD